MTGLVLQLDAELAPHVARALAVHLRWCRDNGISVADGLDEAQRWAEVVARGLTSPVALPAGDDAGVEPLLLTIPQTAELLGCSASRVKTLIAAGQLPVVDFGGVRRVRRVDVDAFLEKLAGGSSFRDDVETKSDPAATGRRLGPDDASPHALQTVNGSAIREGDRQ